MKFCIGFANYLNSSELLVALAAQEVAEDVGKVIGGRRGGGSRLLDPHLLSLLADSVVAASVVHGDDGRCGHSGRLSECDREADVDGSATLVSKRWENERSAVITNTPGVVEVVHKGHFLTEVDLRQTLAEGLNMRRFWGRLRGHEPLEQIA